MNEETNLFVLVCGASGVGKTSVVHRFLKNKDGTEVQPTIGTDLFSVPLPSLANNGCSMLLTVCDPSHKELHGEWPQLAWGASSVGVLLVIDASKPDTLQVADSWLLQVREKLCLGEYEEHSLLMVHKHDLMDGSVQPLGIHQFDAYCAHRGLIGWMYTTSRCA